MSETQGFYDYYRAKTHQHEGRTQDALRLYLRAIDDREFKSQHPDRYLDTLNQAILLARISGESVRADELEERYELHAIEIGMPLYRWWYEKAELLRLQAAASSPPQRGQLIAEAFGVLEKANHEIRAGNLVGRAEDGAVQTALARLYVSAGYPNAACDEARGADKMLATGADRLARLDLDQDLTEIGAFLGKTSVSLVSAWAQMRAAIWSGDSQHRKRAFVNLVALYLPPGSRKWYLMRHGYLIPTMPAVRDLVPR